MNNAETIMGIYIFWKVTPIVTDIKSKQQLLRNSFCLWSGQKTIHKIIDDIHLVQSQGQGDHD